MNRLMRFVKKAWNCHIRLQTSCSWEQNALSLTHLPDTEIQSARTSDLEELELIQHLQSSPYFGIPSRWSRKPSTPQALPLPLGFFYTLHLFSFAFSPWRYSFVWDTSESKIPRRSNVKVTQLWPLSSVEVLHTQRWVTWEIRSNFLCENHAEAYAYCVAAACRPGRCSDFSASMLLVTMMMITDILTDVTFPLYFAWSILPILFGTFYCVCPPLLPPK